jgi:hypothetical protein
MDVSHLHSAIDIDAFADWLDIKSKSTREALQERLKIWRYDIKELESLSYQFASVKQALTNKPSIKNQVDALFEELDKAEPAIQEALTKSSDMENESAAELIFLNNILSPLNFVPFLLTIWSYIRVYIFPGMSLIMPLMMLILPYIIIRFVFHLPIPTDRYLSMIVGLLAGDTNALLNPDSSPSFGELVSTFFESIKQSPIQAMMKLGGIGTTVVQSLVQPYLSYRHLSAINTLLYTKSNALKVLQTSYDSIRAALKSIDMEMPRSPIPELATERQHLAHALLDPVPYKLALRYLGNVRAFYRLCSHKDINPVYWKDKTQEPILKLQDTFDIRVSPTQRIPISINLSEKRHHALLTGPNRGGKSTALRAIALCTLLAHTYGCSIGRYTEMTPYKYLFAALKRDDIPGEKSHFEREVEFTAHTLSLNEPALILVDELFHTTNPPDALASCKIYTDELWKKDNTVSIISTHLFDLVEQTKSDRVQRLCCPASYKDNEGAVDYKYGITEGICKVSSVYEILKKYGYKPILSALKSS